MSGAESQLQHGQRAQRQARRYMRQRDHMQGKTERAEQRKQVAGIDAAEQRSPGRVRPVW